LSDPDRYALELGDHVLGGGFYATRLYHDLRAEAGLVYFVGSSFQFGQTRSIYTVSYGCDPPNVGKARAMIVSNLKAMQERDVTPEEGLLLREIPLCARPRWLAVCGKSPSEIRIQRRAHRARLALPFDARPAAGRADAGGAALFRFDSAGSAGRLRQMDSDCVPATDAGPGDAGPHSPAPQ
jgi:predicted Zn-dependent peptidase